MRTDELSVPENLRDSSPKKGRLHNYGETAKTHTSFMVSQNLCCNFILSRENKPTLLLEMFTEFSSHIRRKSGKISGNKGEYFYYSKTNQDRQSTAT